MLRPQQEVGEPTRLTELQLPGVELHVLQREAGTSGHSQKSSGSSNQQQLHPEQETADRGETSSELLPISAPFYAFSLLHPFFFPCSCSTGSVQNVSVVAVCILLTCVCGCVGVPVIQEEQPNAFFYTQLSYDMQKVQSGGCQQFVERSLNAGRNHAIKFTVKLCSHPPAFDLHTADESHQS